MAYALSTHSLRDFFVAHKPAVKPPAENRRGLLERLVDALEISRQRDAEREIVRYMAGRGEKFTDETERDIERRFLSTPSGW
jgi:hypothetical protein